MTDDRIVAALGRALATPPASGEVECDLCRGYGLTNQGHNCARCGGSGTLAAYSFASTSIGRVVGALEWKAVQDQIPKHAFAAYTPFSRWLIVCEFLSMNHMVYRFDGTDYETLDAAKAAAQADYERRILSALVYHEEPAPGDTPAPQHGSQP